MGFVEWLASANDWLNGVVWGIPMLILIVGTGIYLTVRTGWFQFAKFGHAMKNTIGKITQKQETGAGEITPLQAVTTALAATVGTGNIAGVAGAIALGGPGAVFWMWVSALFGMATKYAEVVLAIKFRQRNKQGDWVGGPMYYITNGLGANWKWLAIIFAAFGALAAFGIGNMTQANTIAGSIFDTIKDFSPAAAGSETIIRLVIGVVIAAFTALVIIGGIKRIGSVTEKMVPIMSIIYIVGALIIVFSNLDRVGIVFKSIFQGAFNPTAAVGGVVGITIIESMKRGVGRGVFSNEAGLGSAPIAHAASSESNPVKQGLYGIFEVFMDTIVICSLTALSVLLSGTAIPYGTKTGAVLAMNAFSTIMGSTGGIIVMIGVVLFASSTILSWCLYGVRCCEYILGEKSIRPYQILFILFIIVGTTMDLGLAWDIADTLNGLMAIPNLVALLGLSGLVFKLTREYKEELKIKKLDA